MSNRWIRWTIIVGLLALPLTAPCHQRQTPVWAYQIEAVNRDVREVLDDLFSKAGKQYVIEPDVRGVVSLRIATNSFEQALNRVLQSAGLIAQVERSQTSQGRVVETYVVRARRPTISPLTAQVPMEILARPVNLVASAKLRSVVALLSKEAGVSITVAPEVPDLEITRLVLKDVNLGYALNILAQATQTQYQVQPDGSILLVPAPQIQVKALPGTPGSRQIVDPTTLRTVVPSVSAVQPQPPAELGTRRVGEKTAKPVLRCICGAELQPHWNYCPMCGRKIIKTPPSRK